MTDDPVADAATKVSLRKAALATTTVLIQRRMDPRLIAADVAKFVLTRAVMRIGAIKTTPKQRKRAIIGAGVAAVTAIGMRVLYRNAIEKPSPDAEDDVKRLL
jgi:hypothetical protein